MSLARLMGHSTTRTLNRYVSNTLDSHLKAVNVGGDRLKKLRDNMSLDQCRISRPVHDSSPFGRKLPTQSRSCPGPRIRPVADDK